jgi:hypothetical protein
VTRKIVIIRIETLRIHAPGFENSA